MNIMPIHSKVGAIVLLIAIGLLSSVTFTWPARTVHWHDFSFTLSGSTLLGLVLFGVACAGTDFIVRGQTAVQPHPQENASYHPTVCHPALHWVLPAGWTTACWALLARPAPLEKQIAYVAIASGVLALLIFTEYYTVNAVTRWRLLARFAVQLSAYFVVALVYLAVHERIPAARIAADTVAAVSAFLFLRLLGEERCSFSEVLLSALGVGSFLGLLSWLLYPRIASPVMYSFLLVVGLYVLTGLAQQFLQGKLRRETLLEYGLVGVVALLLLFLYAR
ncbi:MAG: hypothetical protein QXP01_06970 [Candidatus Hadarchaeum sp.]